jgi:hypothetical protein
MEYAIEASPKRKKFLEAIMPSIVEQCGLTRSTAAVLIKVTKDTPEGYEGSAIPVFFLKNTYMILIKPASYKDLAVTLAHEMVHVRQMAKGMLVLNSKKGHTWMGKKYSPKTPYLKQPWELDALAKQEIIMRRAIEE